MKGWAEDFKSLTLPPLSDVEKVKLRDLLKEAEYAVQHDLAGKGARYGRWKDWSEATDPLSKIKGWIEACKGCGQDFCRTQYRDKFCTAECRYRWLCIDGGECTVCGAPKTKSARYCLPCADDRRELCAAGYGLPSEWKPVALANRRLRRQLAQGVTAA